MVANREIFSSFHQGPLLRVLHKEKKMQSTSRDLPISKPEEPAILSLISTFHDYAHLRKTVPLHQVEEKMYWRLMMDLRAIRKEAASEILTDDILTRITQDTRGHLAFQNPLYVEGTDLVDMYESSTRGLKGEQRARFQLEIDQVKSVWQKTSEILHLVNMDSSVPEITVQLQQFGFVMTELPLTPGILSMFPSLKNFSQSKHTSVLMGPPNLYASPPSRFHRQGESSFVWAARTIYLPELNEFAILQNGLLSGYQETDLNFFLGYTNSKFAELDTEAKIMTYINQLPPEFVEKNSLVIFDEIIKALGHFEPLAPIDKNILPGEFDVTFNVRSILGIFDFEYQQCQAHPELYFSLAGRLNEWANAFQHSSARGEQMREETAVIDMYKTTFQDPEVSQHPEAFAEQIKNNINLVYPGYKFSIDFSLFPCLSGSLLSGARTGDLMNIKMDAHALSLRQLAEKHGIRNRSELKEFCQAHHLPYDLFTENVDQHRCPGCHKITDFIGPCLCPLCHANYNLGLLREAAPENTNSQINSDSENSSEEPLYRKSANFTQFLNNDVYEFPTNILFSDFSSFQHRSVFPRAA